MKRRIYIQGYASPADGLWHLLNSEGGCVGTSEACRLFVVAGTGGTKGLRSRIRRCETIAYRNEKGRYLIPRWQFAPDGQLIPGIGDVLRAMRERITGFNPLTSFAFFLQADPVTKGHTPLDALRAGDIAGTLRAVNSLIL